MTMEYQDVVSEINRAYWKALFDMDGPAREQAQAIAQRFGFQPEAADTMINEYSQGPLQEWLAQKSGAVSV